MTQVCDGSMASVEHFGGIGDGQTDNSAAFVAYMEYLRERGHATLAVPDGTYGIGRTLTIANGISLQMTPGARISALPGFVGDAVVQTQPDGEWPKDQYIIGGTIDGSKLPVVGLRIPKGLGITVQNLIVRNALKTGIEIGAERCHEVNISSIRILVDPGVIAMPDSKGLHYIHGHDSQARDVIVVGFETGVWCTGGSNNFHMVHVWNYDRNIKLAKCFHAAGPHNTYNQCYGDSPIVPAGEAGYGWYVSAPYTRVIACEIFANQWTVADTIIGIHLTPDAKQCAFIGNHFWVSSPKEAGHPIDMRAAFDGALEGSTFLANTYTDHIHTGKVIALQTE
jgi:hypothetical protein